MRHVYEHPEEAGKVGQRAREDMLRVHSPEVRAALLRSRLEAIPEDRRTGSGVPPSLGAIAHLASATPPLGSRHALVRLAQRGLLRMLRPLVNHERAVMKDMVEAMADLERWMQAQTREQMDFVARVLDDTGEHLEALQRTSEETAQQMQRLLAELKASAQARDASSAIERMDSTESSSERQSEE
jgi:hypothetical protein